MNSKQATIDEDVLTNIREYNALCVGIGLRPKMTETEKKYIMDNAGKMTAHDIARKLGRQHTSILRYGKKVGLHFNACNGRNEASQNHIAEVEKYILEHRNDSNASISRAMHSSTKTIRELKRKHNIANRRTYSIGYRTKIKYLESLLEQHGIRFDYNDIITQ